MAVSILFAHSAWAIEPFTVRTFESKGCSVLEPGTVFASLPVKVGDTYTDDKANASIQGTVQSGSVQDVRIEVQGMCWW